MTTGKAPDWLRSRALLGLVEGFGESGPKGYGKYVEMGLVKEDAEKALWSGGALAVGDTDFVEAMGRRYEQACVRCKREDVVLRTQRCYRSAEAVWKEVRQICGADELVLRARKRGRVHRGVMAWALQKHAGLTQRQVAERLGLTSGAAVSLLLRRLERASAPISRRIEKWQKRVNLLFNGLKNVARP